MIQPGQHISVHYELSLEGVGVIETTFDDEPKEFSLGDGTFHQVIESKIQILNVGESTCFDIKAEQYVFGVIDPDKIIVLLSEVFNEPPIVKQMVELNINAQDSIVGRIVSVTDKTVKIDCNNPLIGKTVGCRVLLVNISNF